MQLNMGLTTEMDVNESFAAYRRVRELVLFLLVAMAAVSLAFLLIFRHRARLMAANIAYQKAVQARDDTMAVVSHDLKNPINTILLIAASFPPTPGFRYGSPVRNSLVWCGP